MMHAWVVATEPAALRLIQAIDDARDAHYRARAAIESSLWAAAQRACPAGHEVLSRDGVYFTRPRKPWAVPVQLDDRRWIVQASRSDPRVLAVHDRTRDVGGVPTRIPAASETIEVEAEVDENDIPTGVLFERGTRATRVRPAAVGGRS